MVRLLGPHIQRVFTRHQPVHRGEQNSTDTGHILEFLSQFDSLQVDVHFLFFSSSLFDGYF